MAILCPTPANCPMTCWKRCGCVRCAAASWASPKPTWPNLLGVCRETVCRWWSAYARDGLDALPHERTGRPLGTGRTLSDEQAQQIQQQLDTNSPEELGIPAPLWTRRAVQQLIRKEFGIALAVRTVGAYLRRWGYTAKRPRRHARKQDPEEIRQWLEETYPAIEQRAVEEGADDPLVRRDRGRGGRAPRLRVRPRGRTGHDGGARSAHPHEPDLGDHQRRGGAVHDLRGDDERGTVPGVLGPAVAEHDGQDVPDRGPVAGARDARGGGVGGGPPGPDRGVLPAPLRPGTEPDEYLNNDLKGQVNADRACRAPRASCDPACKEFMGKLRWLPGHVRNYFKHPWMLYAMAA